VEETKSLEEESAENKSNLVDGDTEQVKLPAKPEANGKLNSEEVKVESEKAVTVKPPMPQPRYFVNSSASQSSSESHSLKDYEADDELGKTEPDEEELTKPNGTISKDNQMESIEDHEQANGEIIEVKQKKKKTKMQKAGRVALWFAARIF